MKSKKNHIKSYFSVQKYGDSIGHLKIIGKTHKPSARVGREIIRIAIGNRFSTILNYKKRLVQERTALSQ